MADDQLAKIKALLASYLEWERHGVPEGWDGDELPGQEFRGPRMGRVITWLVGEVERLRTELAAVHDDHLQRDPARPDC